MEKARRSQKEKPLQVEGPALFGLMNKDMFIEVTKRHIDAIAILEGSASSVYTFLSSLYMAGVISLEDLQQIRRHIEVYENMYKYDREDNDEED